jgi:hypothetical protein
VKGQIMTTTPAAHSAAATMRSGGGDLASLIRGTRTAFAQNKDWATTAGLVAGHLAHAAPSLDILTPAEQAGSAEHYTSHTLYVDPGGHFSIMAIVWQPGQHTRIHDHVTWCAFGVLQGVEDEDLFDADLHLIGHNANHAGQVSGSPHPETSTGSPTPATPPPSPSTSTAPTSAASAPAPAATMSDKPPGRPSRRPLAAFRRAMPSPPRPCGARKCDSGGDLLVLEQRAGLGYSIWRG